MVYVLVGVLVLVVLVFGVTSGMESYADAQQAEAVIEVARVGQINAAGNLVVILLVALVILAVVALAAFVLKRRFDYAAKGGPLRSAPSSQATVDVNMLVQLEMLRALRSMQQLPAPGASTIAQQPEEPENAELLYWLRQ